MDWQGQKLVEALMQYLLLFGAVGSFMAGYLTQSYRVMMYGQLVSVVVTLLVTVPDWPFYNRHPIKWLDPECVHADGTHVVTDMVKAKAGKKGAKAKASK